MLSIAIRGKVKNYVVLAESDLEVSNKIAKTFSLNAASCTTCLTLLLAKSLVDPWHFRVFVNLGIPAFHVGRSLPCAGNKEGSLQQTQGQGVMKQLRSAAPTFLHKRKGAEAFRTCTAVQCIGRQWVFANQRLAALKNLSATLVSWTWPGPQNLIT